MFSISYRPDQLGEKYNFDLESDFEIDFEATNLHCVAYQKSKTHLFSVITVETLGCGPFIHGNFAAKRTSDGRMKAKLEFSQEDLYVQARELLVFITT
jgi:hypothetical protein